MPAASFIAKMERDVHSFSAGVYDKLNTLFNEGKDDLFKSVVVEDFLFKYILIPTVLNQRLYIT